MKTRILALITLLAGSSTLSIAAPLGTAFTYQGKLTAGGNPAQGIYDFRFAIYDAADSGQAVSALITNSPVVVTNGLFTTTLDFGSGVFNGEDRWLDIGVRTNGSAADFTALWPRQPLTAAPYAAYAPSAGFASAAAAASAVSGTVAASQITGAISSNNIAAGTITGSMLASGAVGSAQLAPNLTVGGTLTAGIFQGNGDGLTNVSASYAALSANSGLVLNAGHFPAVSTYMATNNFVTGRPLRVLFLGDSLNSAGLGGYTAAFADAFNSCSRVNGTSFSNGGALGIGGPGGVIHSYTDSLTGTYLALTNGASVVVTPYGSGTFPADTVDAYYYTSTNGGNILVESSLQGGGYTTIGTFSTLGSWGLGRTNFALSQAGNFAFRLTAQSGTNFLACGLGEIIHAGYGVELVGLALGGQGWSGFMQCSSNILWGYGRTIQPQLIVIHETSSASEWSKAPVVIDGIMAGCNGNCDVLIIEPAAAPNTDPAPFWAQNAVMERLALQNGWVCFNNDKLYVNPTNAVAKGLMATDVHPTVQGMQFTWREMMKQTGLGDTLSRYNQGVVSTASQLQNYPVPGFYGPSGQCWIGTDPGGATQLQFGENNRGLTAGAKGGIQYGVIYVTAGGNYKFTDPNGGGFFYIDAGNGTVTVGAPRQLTNEFEVNAAFNKSGLWVKGQPWKPVFGAMAYYGTNGVQVDATGKLSILYPNGTPNNTSASMSWIPTTFNGANGFVPFYVDGAASGMLLVGTNAGAGYLVCDDGTNRYKSLNAATLTNLNATGITGTLSLAQLPGTVLTNHESGVNLNGSFTGDFSGTWTTMSDRNAKTNVAPVNVEEVLDNVVALPLSTWNYKNQDVAIRHIGPMAQDFKTLFGVGEADTGITTVDADGVALAAIQGLNRKVEVQDATLEQEVAELKRLVRQLSDKINGSAR